MSGRRQARTDQFLDAALRIVARDGIDQLTVAALAKDLNAAVGALYRYFPGKDDLLAALQVRALDALAAELTIAAAQRKPPLVKLVNVIHVVSSLPERDPPRFRLLDELLSAPTPIYDDGRAQLLEAHLARVLGVVEQAFMEAANAKALSRGDSALRTRVIWACVHGASHLRKRDRLEPKERRHRAIEKAALEALLIGFGASKARAKQALLRT